MHVSRTVLLTALATLTVAAEAAFAQIRFDKVELKTTYGSAEEGEKGHLFVTADRVWFADDDRGRKEYFSIPSPAIEEVFYSRVSGRRIKTAIFVSPLMLFSKGKKHFMTLSFDDGADVVGAVEFRLDKKNYRGVLRAIEQVAGVSVRYDQEGVKAEEESFASAESEDAESSRGERTADARARLEIESDPDGATIEINGEFVGMTPRTRPVEPGEYEVVLTLEGHAPWRGSFTVVEGETFPIRVRLTENEER